MPTEAKYSSPRITAPLADTVSPHHGYEYKYEEGSSNSSQSSIQPSSGEVDDGLALYFVQIWNETAGDETIIVGTVRGVQRESSLRSIAEG